MKGFRILLVFTMLLAIVFKSLPDSIFDHFHQHEHAKADLNKGNSVGNYKHNCHIEDWNFESFEVAQNHYQTYQPAKVSAVLMNDKEVYTASIIHSTGRAPPAA
jgi:hypothetical protein